MANLNTQPSNTNTNWRPPTPNSTPRPAHATLPNQHPNSYQPAHLRQPLNPDAILDEWKLAPAPDRRDIVADLRSSLPPADQDGIDGFVLEKAAEVLREAVFKFVGSMNVPREKVERMLRGEFEKVYGASSMPGTMSAVPKAVAPRLASSTPMVVPAPVLAHAARRVEEMNVNGQANGVQNEGEDVVEAEPPRKKVKKESTEEYEARQALAGNQCEVLRLKVKGGGNINVLTDWYELERKKERMATWVVRLRYRKE